MMKDKQEKEHMASEQLSTSDPEVSKENDVIGIGSIVEIHYAGDPENQTETIQIIGWHGEGNTGDAALTIPSDGPLGNALAGKGTGDTVSFQISKTDPMIEIKIVSVRKPLP